MEILNYKKLNFRDKENINRAKKIALKSITNKKTYVGVVILGDRGGIYGGVTLARTRAIGSTCAERMALDQLFFKGREKPKIVYMIGIFERLGWREDYICTPCGVCLEMFFESIKFFNIDEIKFICSSWNKKNIIKCSLKDLFPKYGNQEWKR